MMKRNTDGQGLPWKQGFWVKARQEGECLIWQAAILNSGYGVYKPPKETGLKAMTAHRMAYLLTHGTLPEKAEIYSFCGNILCICPEHLVARIRIPQPKPVRRIKEIKTKPEPQPVLTPEERFLAKIRMTDSCWIWLGATSIDGYGLFSAYGKRFQAHRFSYSHSVGPIPDGLLVLHSCHRPSCVNPEHLKIGTPKDNNNDMMEAGRQKSGIPVPNNEISLILNDYENGMSINALIRKYRRTRKTIRNLLVRKSNLA